jgi:hypothetical protein
MQIHDELFLRELTDVSDHDEAGVEKEGCHSNTSIPHDVPSWETVQNALYSAIRFAETFLGGAGVVGVHLSRMICTPDAQRWTLAFGEHFFMVEVVGDGFSVRSFRHSVTALAACNL